MTDNVTAVVVTYNRKQLLVDSLTALLAQTRPVDAIILVDNGSTDGTQQLLKDGGYLENTSIEYLRLPENLGAAGGFCKGVKKGYEVDCDWLWLMDDDAITDPNALEALLDAADCHHCVYGTVPMSAGGRLCWEVEPVTKENNTSYKWWHELPDILDVSGHPYLGFMVSKTTIDIVGFPDPGYFIHGEDVDYSERIRKKGLQIKLVKHSKIVHPVHESFEMNILGNRITCYKEPAWKQYYNVRNRIVVAIRHRGIKLLTRTLPGSLIRLYGAIVREDMRMVYIWVFLAGTVDGLLGRMGRRHDKWHIN